MEDMFVRVFPVHILLIAYQYIVEGLNQDRLSWNFWEFVQAETVIDDLLLYYAMYYYGKI